MQAARGVVDGRGHDAEDDDAAAALELEEAWQDRQLDDTPTEDLPPFSSSALSLTHAGPALLKKFSGCAILSCRFFWPFFYMGFCISRRLWLKAPKKKFQLLEPVFD